MKRRSTRQSPPCTNGTSGRAMRGRRVLHDCLQGLVRTMQGSVGCARHPAADSLDEWPWRPIVPLVCPTPLIQAELTRIRRLVHDRVRDRREILPEGEHLRHRVAAREPHSYALRLVDAVKRSLREINVHLQIDDLGVVLIRRRGHARVDNRALIPEIASELIRSHVADIHPTRGAGALTKAPLPMAAAVSKLAPACVTLMTRRVGETRFGCSIVTMNLPDLVLRLVL